MRQACRDLRDRQKRRASMERRQSRHRWEPVLRSGQGCFACYLDNGE